MSESNHYKNQLRGCIDLYVVTKAGKEYHYRKSDGYGFSMPKEDLLHVFYKEDVIAVHSVDTLFFGEMNKPGGIEL